MSEFTATGQRISSRHHSSATSRQAEEIRVPNPTYKNLSAQQLEESLVPIPTYNSPATTKNQNDDRTMLNTPPGTNTPAHLHTDNESLPDHDSPFASDQTPVPQLTSTTTTPFHNNNEHQQDIELGGTADTSLQPRHESPDYTQIVNSRISDLERQLRSEQSNVMNLTSTLSQEILTFDERMLRMEKLVAQLSTSTPPPQSSNTTTVSNIHNLR